MSESKESASAPAVTSSVLNEGYNQTYLIFPPDHTPSDEEKGSGSSSSGVSNQRDVFFRCGNWCYRGPIDFNGARVGTADLPVLIPTLQRQQSSLRYFCNATRLVLLRSVYTLLYCLC